ncbi:MAG: glyoxalase [Alphaproteobacteria bacterium]|nr:glyoxalase [Alphaproteobacteria bacterium]
MKALDVYPLITTPSLRETRDFYVRHFSATILFEASWVVVLSLEGANGGFTLAFMTPDHPSRPPGPEAFDGKGMILTVQTADCAAALRALEAAGAPIDYPLTAEPWGQRRFMTRDPAGVLIDVVEQIAPAEGFWERYAA